jgi:dihydrodipicolinate synthase/N-acetylneuraminate lyase
MLYAFFDPAGGLDFSAIRRQVEACVANGADGIAVLGLATEVRKLSASERHGFVENVASALGGRLPLAVTVAGESPGEQADFARAARAGGATWLILQPPVASALAEPDLLKFLGLVADRVDLPVAIQNAPAYIGSGLSNLGLTELARRCGNVSIVKWEGPALQVKQLIEDTAGRLAVFNGRGGLELPDNIRAGCAGMVPAAETIDLQVRIYRMMQSPETQADAERLYASMLPLIVFLMQSIDILLCYGKRLAARRLGISQVYDRAPCIQPTEFGLAMLDRYSDDLGPLAI